MNGASPHTAGPAFAFAAYFQSVMMVRAVLGLVPDGALSEVIDRLARGETTPEAAFPSAFALTFERHPRGTQLTLRQGPLAARSERALHREGWSELLDHIDLYLTPHAGQSQPSGLALDDALSFSED